MEHFLTAFILFLPAGLANSTPVFASKIPFMRSWNYPVDLGLKVRGIRILGDHKTFRGFITGVLIGSLVSFLLFGFFGLSHLSDGGYLGSTLLFGGMLSFSALLSDSVKSFFKRQIGIRSGSSWVPFDQIDYLIGGSIFISLVCDLDPLVYLWIFVIYGISHPISTFLGHKLGLKDTPI